MGNRENHVMKILQYILSIMVLGTLACFILGEVLLPVENEMESEESTLFQAEWERILPDGTRIPVEVPGECEAEYGENVVIETTLPSNQEDTWFSIWSSQQDLKIYVDNILRKEYSSQGTRLFGKNSANVYVFFEINKMDAGKKLRIETKSNSSYAGLLNEIDMGDKSQIWSKYINRYLPGTLIAVLMLMLSLVVIVYTGIALVVYKRQMDFHYMGVCLLLLSVWILAESRLRQLFLPNSFVATSIGFLVIMLLPYPFLAYVNKIQNRRYQKVYLTIAFCTTLNFILATTLQILNIKDFFETMTISHVIIVALILTMTITIIIDFRKKYVNEYLEVAIGLILFMMSGIWEILLVYDRTTNYNGIPLCIGLVALLFTAGFKTVKDILRVEREKQKAVIASESKAKFLANMSHEIRTPINTVIGMNEMILRKNEDEQIHQYAVNVQNASHMLLNLINDVLDFSKIEAGKLVIVEKSYSVSAMLNDVILGLNVRAEKKKDIEVKLEIEETLPSRLKGDEIRIKQILQNLLSNAVKYTEKGMVTFSVKGMKTLNGFALKMSVKDTGMGIKEEDKKLLFHSFQRMELTKNRYIQGTGLGLSITKQLVDLMQGDIQVESKHGEGSCFTVLLPQEIIDETPMGSLEESYKKEVAKRREEKVTNRIQFPKMEVLAVDDNELNLMVVEELLKDTGLSMEFAHSGSECLEMCKTKKYDLILMDHMMPEPDGVQTLHMLREEKHGLNQETVVIALTANAIAGAKEEYLAFGFNDYLAKPIDVNKLEEMLLRHFHQ